MSLDFLLTKVVILGKRKVLESCVSTNNYRPISLLSVFSKCFGEMIDKRFARSEQRFPLKPLEQDFVDLGKEREYLSKSLEIVLLRLLWTPGRRVHVVQRLCCGSLELVWSLSTSTV